MISPECISDEARAILRSAKLLVLGESPSVSSEKLSREVQLSDLFRAFAVGPHEHLRESLNALGLKPHDIDQYVRAIQTEVIPPPANVPQGLLSTAATQVVGRAGDLAKRHPAEGFGTKVAPIHLWVSLCQAESEFRDWLEESGWSGERVRKLPLVAGTGLPAQRGTPLSGQDSETLRRFCSRNLTELADQGRITAAFGVDDLRRQLTGCLLRKRKRSVVLTGPAGVGKTKLVEDLAAQISHGAIPELSGCQIFELDLSQFTRGTHLVGSRAERWAQLTDVLRGEPDAVILFIDELHTIIGLPLEGQAMDLANALKPLMVDETVRIIGATTVDEYRRHIEGDPALARRFSEIKIPEPARDGVLRILENTAPDYEAYHQVRFSQEAFESIIDLAQQYLPNQSFPAKAVDLMDEVGVQMRMQSRDGNQDAFPLVEARHVTETLRRIRGVEPDSLNVDLAALIEQRVIGQSQAATTLDNVIVSSAYRYGMKEHVGPRAVILFAGPPGVGKSYMARVLSDILFPGRDNMLVLDMTEFSGPHTGEHARFRLLGPPPPYVGWENGGLLTSHALQHPISVVLIDEFEKADHEARNTLLRIFNDGWTEDGRGRTVSFRGIYFILTANAGRSLWEADGTGEVGFVTTPKRTAARTDDQVREAMRREGVAPELLSRISHVVLFNQLTTKDFEKIACLRFSDLRDRALLEDSVLLDYDEPAMAEWLVKQITLPDDSDTTLPPDTRRLRAAFEDRVELPIARWRLQQRRGETAILKMAPGDETVVLDAVSRDHAAADYQQMLFDRVGDLFSRRNESERRTRQTRVCLGT